MWMIISTVLMKVLIKDYGKGNVCDTDSTAGRDGNIFF